jgi:thioredoxin-related protein
MNKFIAIVFIGFSITLNAQNRQINFETGNLASVFEKAKKENKLVFVDAYTTWCGPCKHMAKHVFTNDTVADYYNSWFINLKLDMEKGEGLDFAKKYTVNCYPNLMVLDADGNVIHRQAGSVPSMAFVQFGKNAKDPEKAYGALKKKYESTDLNENNVVSYIDLLMGCCLDPSERALKYISTVKEEDLLKQNNWIVVRDFVYNHEAREIKYFLKNQPAFEKQFGKDEVEQKMAQLGKSYFSKYSRAAEFDETGYEKAKKEFTAMNWPGTDAILFASDLETYVRFNKTKYFEIAAAGFLKYNKDNANALNSMAWDFYEKVSDKKLLNSAVGMAKRACELNSNYANLDTYAAVLYKAGEMKEAEIYANKAIAKAKEEKMDPKDYKDTSALLDKIKAKR